MKAWKWAALAASGGLLLQAGACVTDLGYYLMQAVATQVIAGAIAAAAGTTA